MEPYKPKNVTVTVQRKTDEPEERTKEEVIKQITRLVTGKDPEGDENESEQV